MYLCVLHTCAAAHKPVREREFGAGFARALQKFRAVLARRANRRSVYFGAYNTYTPAASAAGKGARDYHADCRRTRRLDASARPSQPARFRRTRRDARTRSAHERQGARRRRARLWNRCLHLARGRARVAAFPGSGMLIWTEP